MTSLTALRDAWQARWPDALATWSRFTRLSDPRWCLTLKDAKREGIANGLAQIRFVDHAITVNLVEIEAQGLNDYAVEFLAHEIGHHVYCPGDIADNARLLARIRRGLPGQEAKAPFVSNLYADLLINDRLQRGARLRIGDIYRALAANARRKPDRLWTFYMRTYEILWGLVRGSLATAAATPPATEPEAQLEGDAQLAARVIRVYARDWMRGATRFALLALPYLVEDASQMTERAYAPWRDTENAGAEGFPEGLTELDDDELGDVLHPAQDPELTGLDGDGAPQDKPAKPVAGKQGGQHREPFQYGEILRQLGIKMDDLEIAVRYYRERALPFLIPFPSEIRPESSEPLPEGLEPWDIGSPFESADWTQSVMHSPRVIPGMTTVQRVWGTTEGALPEREPLDLDLYVDCSGSMPDPRQNVSYLTLAGAIITLSCLRAGGRAQVTLWSGAQQFKMTDGFTRDADAALRVLSGYFGGGTAFPIHVLRETYVDRKPTDRPVRILVISDDGVTTMFDKDEKGNSGWDIATQAVARARGGATMALNIHAGWRESETAVGRALRRASAEQGWEIFAVSDWAGLVAFARGFSRDTFGKPGRQGALRA
ncbi:MAG: hypothetical protein K1X39_13630 [Thermoflexales bacterium]|nr:hypothetical protein [Thermoflexales bacterium]